MKVFAIRHKPTGEFMPHRMYRTRERGWSHWVPGPEADGWAGANGYDKNPRLFFTLQSARNALTAWLQGPWKATVETDGDWETGYYDVPGTPAPTSPPAPRHRADMEIVTFTLSEEGR